MSQLGLLQHLREYHWHPSISPEDAINWPLERVLEELHTVVRPSVSTLSDYHEFEHKIDTHIKHRHPGQTFYNGL